MITLSNPTGAQMSRTSYHPLKIVTRALSHDEIEARYPGADVQKMGPIVSVTASTADVDRASDIVSQHWELGAFLDNPVILQNHDYRAPVVGRALRAEVNAGSLEVDIEFDTEPTNPDGQRIASQFARGFMNAVSVGFVPGSAVARATLPEGDPWLGEHGFVLGSESQPNHLLELSVVSVPANPAALSMAAKSAAVASAADVLAEIRRSPEALAELRAIIDADRALQQPAPDDFWSVADPEADFWDMD